MDLELVSHPLCPYVHRSAIMLAEKGVPFSRRDIDLEAKPDWFLAISPRGKVPVLLADGEPLFESAAINEFLDETNAPRLLPADAFERARQRAWVEVANDLLSAQYAVLVAPASDLADKKEKLSVILRRLDDALEKGTLDERSFGLVHVAFAPAFHRFVVIEEKLGVRLLEHVPRVEALARRVTARPSVTGTVASDFADRFIALLVKRGSSLARPS